MEGSWRGRVVGLLLPFVATALQWPWYDPADPTYFLLFYPAVFYAAWIGGRAVGIVAVVTSAMLVSYLFMPPMYEFVLSTPRQQTSMVVFVVMGIVFSLAQTRLLWSSGGAHHVRALWLSEQRVNLALEGSGQAVWDWNVAAGTVEASPKGWAMLGHEGGGPVETAATVGALAHPDDLTALKEAAERHFRGEVPVLVAEFRVRSRDGAYVWVETRGMVVEWTADRKPRRVIGTLACIDERKALQLVLENAKNSAEADARAKNAFLATVSHEMRTPLNAIIGFSEVLLQGSVDPEESRKQLSIIRRSGQELLRLVQETLDLANIEGGGLVVQASAFGLRTVLEEARNSMTLAAAARHLDFAPVECDESVVVWADRPRLAQVLRNLLANAIKFTDHGCIHLRASVGDGSARIEVEDSGIGVSAEQLGRLFNPFERALGQPGPLRSGTGLGLAVSRRIVEAMGGTIGVESEPGKGSLFWFTVPLAVAVARVDEFPSAHARR